MKTTQYQASDGTILALSDPQRIALQHAGLMRQYGPAYISSASAKTYSDAEIADMCEGRVKMTSIHLKDRPYRGAEPFVVYDPQPNGTPTACSSFDSALDAAQKYGCNVVTVPAQDVEPAYYGFASNRGITILAV